MNFDTDPNARRAQRISPENLAFTINGKTFKVISGYAPEAPGADVLADWRTMDPDISDEAFAKLADEVILKFLQSGQEDAWRDARRPDAEHPITGFDLVDVVHWLVEAVVSRPLEQPSDSSNGSTSPSPTPAQAAPIAKPLTVVSPSREGPGSSA